MYLDIPAPDLHLTSALIAYVIAIIALGLAPDIAPDLHLTFFNPLKTLHMTMHPTSAPDPTSTTYYSRAGLGAPPLHEKSAAETPARPDAYDRLFDRLAEISARLRSAAKGEFLVHRSRWLEIVWRDLSCWRLRLSGARDGYVTWTALWIIVAPDGGRHVQVGPFALFRRQHGAVI